MRPTKILSDEHKVILVVLGVLEEIVTEAQSKRKLDTDSASKAVEFFKTFADTCHHGKEESCLFIRLNEKGWPSDQGPIGVMLYEHQQGRALVKAMSQALDEYKKNEEQALDEFCAAALSYLDLLRGHINKEDQCLFPMADNSLSDKDQKDLLVKFEQAQKTCVSAGTYERMLSLADGLGSKCSSGENKPGKSCSCSA
jgi:hemerythrin-like domain-containing protein